MAEIVTPKKRTTKEAIPESADPSRMHLFLLTLGSVLATAGWLDIFMLWIPPRFGEADWEFGTIAQSLDALPLPTVGIVMLGLAVLARAKTARSRKVIAIVCGVVAVWLILSAFLFALDLPQALTAMRRDARMAPGIKAVIMKSALYLAVYISGYAFAAFTLWRRPRVVVQEG